MEERDLKGLFEALTPTEAHKEKLYSQLLSTGQASGRGKKVGRKLRPAFLALAAFLCLFATSAYSASYLGLDVKWLNFLNPASGEQEQYLANGAYVVDQTIKNENGTLVVKQIMGDSNLLYILMDFVAPEGTVLDKARYRFQGYLDTKGIDSSGIGFDQLEDDNPQDNRISLVMSVMTNRIETGQEATLTLEDLEEADPYPDEFEEIIKGQWKTSFKLDFKDTSKRYEVGRSINIYGHKATLEALSVSPISVTVFLRSTEEKEIWEEANKASKELGPNVNSDTYPITIHYKNGTSETTSIFSGMAQGHPDQGDLMVVKPFLPILDTDQIESLEFFGVTVPTQG